MNVDDWFDEPPRIHNSVGTDRAIAWLRSAEGTVFLTMVSYNCCDLRALQVGIEQWVVDHPEKQTFRTSSEAREQLRETVEERHRASHRKGGRSTKE